MIKGRWNTKNLFGNTIKNRWISTTGEYTTLSNTQSTHLLECKEGDTFTIKALFENPDPLNIVGISFRDSNDANLLRKAAANSTNTIVTLTAPINTKYVVFLLDGAPKYVQAEKGSVATKYVPYIQTAKEIKGRWNTKNLFNINVFSEVLSGGVLYKRDGDTITLNGTCPSYTTCNIYDSIFIPRNTPFTVSFITSKSGVGIRLRNRNTFENYIVVNNGKTYSVDYDIDYLQIFAGTGAEKVYDDYIKDIMVEIGNTKSSYVPYIQNIKEIKTKIDGEVKTICLDYELAEDVQVSTISALSEDDVNEMQT